MREIVWFRRLALTAFVAATVTVATLASSVPAYGADDGAAAEARKHYEEGTKAFNLGEFARAIAEFKATYNVKPDPLLLYNIAQSYRLAGDPGQAMFFYKSFLRNMPNAPNRKDVEIQIRKLERQVDEQKREAPGFPPVGAAPGAVVPPSTGVGPTGAIGATSPPPPTLSGEATGVPPVTAHAPGAGAPRTSSATFSGTSNSLAAPPPPPQSSGAAIDLSAAAQRQAEESRPIYKKWWFWTGVAGAAVIIGGLAAANAKKAPQTPLGTFDPMFQ